MTRRRTQDELERSCHNLSIAVPDNLFKESKHTDMMFR